jgi:hypothetical protein
VSAHLRGARPSSWTLPSSLQVWAFDLTDRTWSKVYEGASDMQADGSSVIASSVLADPPAGLGTWGWWYEMDAAGTQGPDAWDAPATTAGKTPPADMRAAT